MAVNNSGSQAVTYLLHDGVWRETSMPDVGSQASVSCASATHCVVLGVGVAATFNNGSWSTQSVDFAGGSLTEGSGAGALSCPTVTFCVAVASDEAYELSGGHWHSQSAGLPVQGSLLAVSCPQAGTCMAIGDQDVSGYVSNEYTTFAARLHAGSWSETAGPSLPPGVNSQAWAGAFLSGISCATTNYCVAVGYQQTQIVGADQFISYGLIETWDHGSWSLTKSEKLITSRLGAGSLWSVSCPTTSFCLATGGTIDPSDDGTPNNKAVAWTDTDGSWSKASEIPFPDGVQARIVSCSVSVDCEVSATGETDSGGYYGKLFSTTGPYVALGDSFSAGDGAIPDKANYRYPNSCHVTPDSYPKIIARTLGISVQDEACTGSAIDPGKGAAAEKHISNQITKIPKDSGLITITLGGNDTPIFADIELCNIQLLRSALGCASRYWGGYQDAVAALPDKLEKVFREIHARAPMARLDVLSYPSAIPSDISGKCDHELAGDFIGNDERTVKIPLVIRMLKSDMPFFRESIDKLNAAIARAVAATFEPEPDGSTWKPQLVEMTGSSVPSDFEDHSLCSADSWEWPLRLGNVPVESSLHPNIAGNAAMSANALATIAKPDPNG